LGKRISICIVVAISLLALLSLFTSGPIVRAQTQPNSTSTNSTAIASAISSTQTSNLNTTSTTSYVLTSTSEPTTLVTTIDTTSSISSATLVTSTSFVASNTTTYTSSVTDLTSTTDDPVTVTVTSTASTATAWSRTWRSSTDYGGYSISFSPQYWFCSDVSVTFTGPLVESGHYGDILQFQYLQYNPTYPSVLNPIFTDAGLTVTSDTVNYWINANEYAQVNFAYQPNIAVKVLDLTPKSNGYTPGLIFMDLTNITPQGLQYCTYSAPAPEFQVQWFVIVASIVLSLVVLRIRKQRHPKLTDLVR
jgi:hypothetical protein